MKQVFSARALDDLVRLREFIAQKNPQAAGRVARVLLTTLHRFVDHPHLGRPVEEFPAYRDLVAGAYVVRYRFTVERVEVIPDLARQGVSIGTNSYLDRRPWFPS